MFMGTAIGELCSFKKGFYEATNLKLKYILLIFAIFTDLSLLFSGN